MKPKTKVKKLGQKDFQEVELPLPKEVEKEFEAFGLEIIISDSDIWIFLLDKDGQDVEHYTIINANLKENFDNGFLRLAERLKSAKDHTNVEKVEGAN